MHTMPLAPSTKLVALRQEMLPQIASSLEIQGHEIHAQGRISP